jgi:hypothetical protein
LNLTTLLLPLHLKNQHFRLSLKFLALPMHPNFLPSLKNQ